MIDFIIGTLISGILAAISANYMLNGITYSNSTEVRHQGLRNALHAFDHLLRMGRLSLVCSKPADVTGLECKTDFAGQGAWPSNPNTRLILNSKHGVMGLSYEVRSGVTPTEQWQPKLHYAGITDFEICDSDDLDPNLGICTLNSPTTPLGNIPAHTNRYFRFGFGRKVTSLWIVGAFFTRNSSANGVTYVWGTRGERF